MFFEVPYNFDEKLIQYYQKNKSFINYLYLPPYKEDAANTRTDIQTDIKGHCYMPQSRKEYETHLRKLTEAGLHFVVLWQVNDQDLSLDLLNYYCELHTSGFIVANDRNAEFIKKNKPKLIVICSVVQRICYNIMEKDLSNYDYVILYYPFNRALNALKHLAHLKEKLILMPNSLCDFYCPSIHHWFPTNERPFIPSRDCSMTIDNMGRCSIIFPEHLYLFDNYVAGFKLQGREYPTDAIKYLCHFYFKRDKYEDFISPFLAEDMANRLKYLMSQTSIEEYYNSATSYIQNKFYG